MNADAPLTEADRFPLLDAKGKKMLRWLQEHPNAPRYNFPCGDRLRAENLERVQEYERVSKASPRGWRAGEIPPWLRKFAAFCLEDVPAYRRRGGSADKFFSIPTTGREDLRREPWAYVPDSQSLDDLIVYYTSGTTGYPLHILSHPESPAKYIGLMRRALARWGVKLEGGSGRVSIVLVCAQHRTFTYPAVFSVLDGAGFAKINLNPSEWRKASDRVKFLDECKTEIYTGDPISFLELSKLRLKTRPKALISTAMTLLPRLREKLEERFACPVLDFYSMNETGPVAATAPDGMELLPHDLYVEILDAKGATCRPGERGEITVSGGRNPFLPLLRYRTGDWASLDLSGKIPRLVGLEGRPPTLFRDRDGRIINNIDVSTALREIPLSQFSLHQSADGSLRFKARGFALSIPKIQKALESVFGPGHPMKVEEIPDDVAWEGKMVPYSSDFNEVTAERMPALYLSG